MLAFLLSPLPAPVFCVFACACFLFPLPVLKYTVSNVAEGWGTAGSNAQADGEAAPDESGEAGAKLDQLASQVCLRLLYSLESTPCTLQPGL